MAKKNETPQTMDALRGRIDQLDAQIQQLIVDRAACAKAIAECKQQAGDAVFYRPEREAQILRKVMERDCGLLRPSDMARVFREIMSSCLAVEQPLAVAYLGPEGTYTQEAAFKHFGHAVAASPCASVSDVFRAVETGRVPYGVVPVENSAEGSVSQTLDMFLQSAVKICGEVELRIRHQLLGTAADLSDIKAVYAHPQALAQCREWLDRELPAADRIAASSNAEAARLVAQLPAAAAIASDTAAEIYGLKILRGDIEDSALNTTRFLVLSLRSPPPSGRDKTSLLIATGNQPGALHRALSPLAKHKISMTRIQSRPSRRGMWDYVFFIDIEGHAEDEAVKEALDEIRPAVSSVTVLGAYPCAVV